MERTISRLLIVYVFTFIPSTGKIIQRQKLCFAREAINYVRAPLHQFSNLLCNPLDKGELGELSPLFLKSGNYSKYKIWVYGITSKSLQRYQTLRDFASFNFSCPWFCISVTICFQNSRIVILSTCSVFYLRPRGKWCRHKGNLESQIRHFVIIIFFLR